MGTIAFSVDLRPWFLDAGGRTVVGTRGAMVASLVLGVVVGIIITLVFFALEDGTNGPVLVTGTAGVGAMADVVATVVVVVVVVVFVVVVADVVFVVVFVFGAFLVVGLVVDVVGLAVDVDVVDDVVTAAAAAVEVVTPVGPQYVLMSAQQSP